jgi:hypothetical protein
MYLMVFYHISFMYFFFMLFFVEEFSPQGLGLALAIVLPNFASSTAFWQATMLLVALLQLQC